jgi:hypothetical protein
MEGRFRPQGVPQFRIGESDLAQTRPKKSVEIQVRMDFAYNLSMSATCANGKAASSNTRVESPFGLIRSNGGNNDACLRSDKFPARSQANASVSTRMEATPKSDVLSLAETRMAGSEFGMKSPKPSHSSPPMRRVGMWALIMKCGDPWSNILLAAMGVSLSLIGPGVWSLATRLCVAVMPACSDPV